MTLNDGSNVKYLIRPPQADKKQDLGGKLAISNETISSLIVGAVPIRCVCGAGMEPKRRADVKEQEK